MGRGALIAVLVLLLAACASAPPSSTGGGYSKDDGPPSQTPADISRIPDAVPRKEALHKFANRPYTALGRTYTPNTSFAPFRQTGLASWYGKAFHGKRTASGEPYDMLGMTAAHTTLPIPSYVRVTNLANQRSVVLRVNDRGPFHDKRVIDVSYAAAVKLDLVRAGSAQVRVELVRAD